MDRIHDACILLFARYDPMELFRQMEFGHPERQNSGVPSVKSFTRMGMAEPEMGWYGHAGIEALASKVSGDWVLPFGASQQGQGGARRSAFHLLARAAEPMVLNFDFEPRVKHQHMLRWRKLALHVTSDLLMCAHLAWSDVAEEKLRRFRWPYQPHTDNRGLNGMLGRGVAENHAHLQATAPIFEGSWLALMTHPMQHLDALKKLGAAPLDAKVAYSDSVSLQLQEATLLAAAVRWCIHRRIASRRHEEDAKGLHRVVEELKAGLSGLPAFAYFERQIELSMYLAGRTDYVPWGSKNDAPELVKGERQLLYRTMWQIFHRRDAELDRLLHAYLLLKHRVRRELVQTNGRKGFGNFKFYQDRKSHFIRKHPALYEQAISDALEVKCAPEMGGSLEYRIGPKEKASQLEATIRDIARAKRAKHAEGKEKNPKLFDEQRNPDDDLKELVKANIFFTLHFFKKREQTADGNLFPLRAIRHNELRKLVARQARAIMELRAKGEVWSKLIRGIDAASSEFNARPEVFAVAFRMLRQYSYNLNRIPFAGGSDEDRLRVTFHAGEDFYCLTDGLRYVEEAMRLLEYQDGDRLGHGLALGIDAQKFFETKRWEILLPKQELLDNLIWILWMTNRHDIDVPTSVLGQINQRISELSTELYRHQLRDKERQLVTTVAFVEHYTWAYLLRGDDPNVYIREPEGNRAKDKFKVLYPDAEFPERWKSADVGDHMHLDKFRDRNEVRNLVRAYHQDPIVRTKGAEMTRFDVPRHLVPVVTRIQNVLMSQIQKHHIGIECNPSSNVLIGPIDRFEEHPILRFYNRELQLADPENRAGLPESPQLLVSINSDDAGIFGTSLETEYALLARALEKKKDAKGQPVFKPHDVYAWLDRIRVMGMDQSFISRDRHK